MEPHSVLSQRETRAKAPGNQVRGDESKTADNSKRCLPAAAGLDMTRVAEESWRMEAKNSAQDFPYTTHLNVLYKPLEVIDVQKLVDACTDKWYNQTLCRVNDSVVRLGIVQGEYHWHSHQDLDEFFYVVHGRFLIDLENGTVDLGPKQGFVVPKGVRHRTRALERTVILMVEGEEIVPTGD